MKQKLKTRGGYIALISVTLVMVFLLIFLTSTQLITVNNLRISGDRQLANEVLYIAESCLADVLYQLGQDPFYEGNSFSIIDGSCEVTVDDMGSNIKNITVNAVLQGVYFLSINANVQVVDSGEVIDVRIVDKNYL